MASRQEEKEERLAARMREEEARRAEAESVTPHACVFLSSGPMILTTLTRVELVNKMDRVREDDHKWITFVVERPAMDGTFVTVKGTFRLAEIIAVTGYNADDD